MSDMMASIRAFMASFDPAPRPELHCGQAVWDALRDLGPKDTGPVGLNAALGGVALSGIPVHVDRAMAAGRWELREAGEVTRTGDITPEPGAFYVPGLGFVQFNDVQEDE